MKELGPYLLHFGCGSDDLHGYNHGISTVPRHKLGYMGIDPFVTMLTSDLQKKPLHHRIYLQSPPAFGWQLDVVIQGFLLFWASAYGLQGAMGENELVYLVHYPVSRCWALGFIEIFYGIEDTKDDQNIR